MFHTNSLVGRRKITIEAPTWSDIVRLYTLSTDITSSTTSVRKTFFKLIKPNNMSKRDVGLWGPTDCKPDEKLAIIVPYRNRDVHLRLFVKHMHEFLRRKQLMYTIFVINQVSLYVIKIYMICSIYIIVYEYDFHYQLRFILHENIYSYQEFVLSFST